MADRDIEREKQIRDNALNETIKDENGYLQYEKDLKEHNNEVRELNFTIRHKDTKIRDLT